MVIYYRIGSCVMAWATLLLSGCGGIYSAQSIKGTLVDADTNQPLPGVVIVAQWKIDRRWVGDEKALLKLMETVSDADGRYHFPAWGPILLPARADFGKGEDPRVTYFMHGYWPASMQNEVAMDVTRRATHLGGFKGNDQKVTLRKWDRTNTKKYSDAVSEMTAYLPLETVKDWKMFPRLTLEIEKTYAALRKRKDLPWGYPLPRVNGFFMEDLSNEDRAYLQGFVDEQ